MTAIQLNAEMLRSMSLIAEDETLLRRAVKYLRKLVAEKEAPTLLTKEEFFHRIDKAREQIKRGEGIEMLPDESLDEFLERVWLMYKIIYSPRAIEDLQRLKRYEPAAYKKAGKFIQELKEHPKTGTGHPEQLKGDRAGQWSRAITKKIHVVNCHDVPTYFFVNSSCCLVSTSRLGKLGNARVVSSPYAKIQNLSDIPQT